MYVKKLELSIKNLNEKLDSIKLQYQKLKDENAALKASNDNHIYISDRLNQALKKQILKFEKLKKDMMTPFKKAENQKLKQVFTKDESSV